jgi:uncharacterized protein
MGASPEGSSFSGLVRTYAVRSEARVDEIIAEAKKAGATMLQPAATKQWGGYGASLRTRRLHLGHQVQRPGKN